VKVGYNPAWPIVFLVLGGVGLLLGLWVSAIATFSPMVFIGPLMLILGVLQLTRPYFEFDPRTRTITVKALVGSMARRFGGAEGGRLSVQGTRIINTRADGTTKKVPVSRAMAKRNDWDLVLTQLS